MRVRKAGGRGAWSSSWGSRRGFSESDIADIEQDLRFGLWERLGNFDPERAKFTTFVRRVVEKKVAKILRDRVAEKRDFRRNGRSLSETRDEGAQTVAQEPTTAAWPALRLPKMRNSSFASTWRRSWRTCRRRIARSASV